MNKRKNKDKGANNFIDIIQKQNDELVFSNLFKYIFDLCNSFNYDDSDGQIDYFNCGFYDSMSIGKWDKKFELING